MNYIYETTDITLNQESIVVLGNFDGVHRGHQKLLNLATQKAQVENKLVAAFSFYPHPTWVLGNNPKQLIMSRAERKSTMEEVGVDVFIEYPFTKEFAAINPEQFFKNILVDQLKAHTIVVGKNYYFGKKKQGDVVYLKKLGEKYNVEVIAVDTVSQNAVTISSTQIRDYIMDGQMEQAREQLGRPYTIIGTVVHGKKLGRTRGFPTANIVAQSERVYPPNGVYASRIKIDGTNYWGITNVGYNPTVSSQIKMIETNIFDFEAMIYGQEIEVSLLKFIRPEKKFENLEALYEQINKDTESAKNFCKQDRSSLQA